MAHRPSIRRGDELVLDVEQLAEAGDGLARIEEFPIFVGGALAGERVRARVVAVHEAHARAELVGIDRTSADRVEPRCEHFGSCTGCRLQHVADPARRATKLRRLESALRRHLGSESPEIEELAECAPYGTRCRIAVQVARSKGRMRCGLLDRAGKVFDLDECPAVRDGAVAVARAIVAEARARSLPALRAVVAHASSAGDQVQATLVAETARLPHAQRLADVASEAGATGVCLNQHDGRADRMFGRRTTALRGRAFLVETVGDLRLRVSATTFFEMTYHGAVETLEAVVRGADIAAGDRAVDLYSGSGRFALALARAGAAVTAVESGRQAVHDADGSANDLGLTSATFVEDRAEARLTALARLRPRVVVADPPASGCSEEIVAGIARLLTPQRVVLVGRDPGTLGRDAAGFAALGYRVVTVAPVDSDPLAREIAAVVTLARRAG